MIRHERIEDYLHRLASGDPTPGGGATGALAVAEGAALVSMSAHYGDLDDVVAACAGIVADALAVADEDEAGFGAVVEAFGLPKDDDGDRRARSAAIQRALEQAVRPPRAIVDAAERVLEQTEAVLADGDPQVLSDVGAALGCVRAGLTAAAVTLQINLDPLKDEGLEGELAAEIDRADRLAERTDGLVARVRRGIAD